jgi:hypothetical protein
MMRPAEYSSTTVIILTTYKEMASGHAVVDNLPERGMDPEETKKRAMTSAPIEGRKEFGGTSRAQKGSRAFAIRHKIGDIDDVIHAPALAFREARNRCSEFNRPRQKYVAEIWRNGSLAASGIHADGTRGAI